MLRCKSGSNRDPRRKPRSRLSYLALPGIAGDLIPDAHLAALAIAHGLTLSSTDGDYARFPRLRWLNPLRRRGWTLMAAQLMPGFLAVPESHAADRISMSRDAVRWNASASSPSVAE